MYVINANEATYFEGDLIKTVEQLPAGVWGIGYRSMTNAPFFYKMEDYKTSHGKIYGKVQTIAKHVIDAFDTEKDKNIGALFSGAKGLGKSLTIRLIVEHYMKTRPVIIVDRYTNILSSVLSDLKDCVIILDEFEKMFKNNNDEGMTPQESLLSVLDGTKSISHNLYLLSVNDVFKLDDNLISRPGRIRYHFKYENISDDVIREFCNDNLIKERAGDIDDVIDAVKSCKVESLDIVQSIVNEMNIFKDNSVADIIKIMNVCDNNVSVDITATYSVDGHQAVLNDTWKISGGTSKGWLDDVCFLKIKVKDVSVRPTVIPPSDYIVERWDGCYPNVVDDDPYWKQFEEDGELYLHLDSKDFIKKHNVKIESITVHKHFDWGAF